MPASSGGLATAEGTFVLDSWPVMEWLKGRQPLAADFRTLLANARIHKVELVISTINLGEIYYNCWNEWDEGRAEQVRLEFTELPIRVVHPTAADAHFAARLKGRFKVSYADAFAAVLAIELNAPVMTGDRDFLKLKDVGVLSVEWLGA
jgi:uncharacterized protein